MSESFSLTCAYPPRDAVTKKVTKIEKKLANDGTDEDTNNNDENEADDETDRSLLNGTGIIWGVLVGPS